MTLVVAGATTAVTGIAAAIAGVPACLWPEGQHRVSAAIDGLRGAR